MLSPGFVPEPGLVPQSGQSARTKGQHPLQFLVGGLASGWMLWGVIGLLLLFLFPTLAYWLNRLELLSFEDRQRRVSENRHHTGIVLVEIDRASLNNMTLRKAFGRYPWRREVYAHVVNYFKEAKAKALVLELSFTGGEDLEHPEADQRFYESLESGLPVMSALTEVSLKEVQGVESPEARNLLFAKFRQEYLSFSPEDMPQVLHHARFYEALQLPMADFLRRPVRTFPMDNLVDDENGRVRQVYLLGRGHLDKPFPTFPLAAAMLGESDRQTQEQPPQGQNPNITWRWQKPDRLVFENTSANKENANPNRAIDFHGEAAPIIRWVGAIAGPPQGEASAIYPRYRISDIVLSRLAQVCQKHGPEPRPAVCNRVDLSGVKPLPSSVFQGKRILVGYHSDWFDANQHSSLYDVQPSEAQFKDAQPTATPASGRGQQNKTQVLKYPNLFIQANVLDNILSNAFVQRAPWRVTLPNVLPGFSGDTASVSLLTLLTVCLLGGGVFVMTLRHRQVVWGMVLATGLLFAYSSLTVWAYVDLNVWLNWIYPTLAILLGLFMALLIRMHRAERQRIQLRMTFGRYISPANLAYIEKHPDKVKLGSHKKELTFLFCDIRGFTGLAEHYPADVVQQLLDTYYGQMNHIIMNRYGGVIGKMMGDGILAYWGFPLESDDDALMTVSAALEMQQAIAVWNARQRPLAQDGLGALGQIPPIEIGIGINTGEALIGNVGSVDFMDFTVIGDSVNVAARLEKLNKQYGTGIIISGATYERVCQHIHVESLGRVVLSGRSEPLQIYTPTGIHLQSLPNHKPLVPMAKP